jgi:hypothetical protein
MLIVMRTFDLVAHRETFMGDAHVTGVKPLSNPVAKIACRLRADDGHLAWNLHTPSCLD